MDKVTRQCPQTTTFEKKGELKRIRTEVLNSACQPNALPLDQTGSQGESLLNMRYLYSVHRLVCFVNMEKQVQFAHTISPDRFYFVLFSIDAVIADAVII